MNSKSTSLFANRLPLIGGALFWSVVHAWVLHRYFEFTWTVSGWDSFIFNLWIFGAAVLTSTLQNYLSKTGILQVTIGLALILAFSSYWISLNILQQIIPSETSYLDFVLTSAPVRWILAFVIIAGLGISSIYHARWIELLEVRNLEADTESLAKEAELQKLQLQLQPHFLFNSLNSINALILVQPDQAQKMVQQLSDFLRLTLKRADEPWVSLDQELEYLQTYLAIEKVRFGHRLEVILNINEQSRPWPIPTLVLQPLLENAIKFGLYGTTGKISIEVITRVDGNQLEISISNPFDADMQPAVGSGFGLNGLKRRLYLLYARNDLIKTTVADGTFVVNLIVPARV